MSTKDEAKKFVLGRRYRLKDFDAAQDFFFLMAAFADEQAKNQSSLLEEARELLQDTKEQKNLSDWAARRDDFLERTKHLRSRTECFSERVEGGYGESDEEANFGTYRRAAAEPKAFRRCNA